MDHRPVPPAPSTEAASNPDGEPPSPSLPLTLKKCAPCHRTTDGATPTPYTPSEAQTQLDTFFPKNTTTTTGDTSSDEWYLTHDSHRIRKDYTVRNFTAGIEFFRAIAVVAEEEGHHPDLRLEDYRRVSVEIWTHVVGGLTENDFILAAKIDRLPVRLAKKKK